MSGTLTKKAAKPTGEFRGKKISPNSVKKTVVFQGLTIRIDRPKGFIMRGTDKNGTAWERRYKYDYGYLPRTQGGDGDGLDVFIGPEKKATETYWALQRKDDGSFDEYKVFLGFPNRDAATAVYKQHIPKKLLSGMITMKIGMMKAMLGRSPGDGLEKAASLASLTDELNKIEESSAGKAAIGARNYRPRNIARKLGYGIKDSIKDALV